MFASKRDLLREHPRCRKMPTNPDTPKRKGRRPSNHDSSSVCSLSSSLSSINNKNDDTTHDDMFVTIRRLSKGGREQRRRSGGKRRSSVSSPHPTVDAASNNTSSSIDKELMCLPWSSSVNKTSCSSSSSSFLESSERSTATTASCSSVSTFGSLPSMLASSTNSTTDFSMGDDETTASSASTGPRRRKRQHKIRFRPSVQVRVVQPVDELAEEPRDVFWYQPHEFDAINVKIGKIVAKVRAEGNDPSIGVKDNGRKTIICTRGLERVMESYAVRQARMQAVYGVLDLQEEVGYDVKNYDRVIAEQYILASQDAVDDAIEQAFLDEEAANSYYSKD